MVLPPVLTLAACDVVRAVDAEMRSFSVFDRVLPPGLLRPPPPPVAPPRPPPAVAAVPPPPGVVMTEPLSPTAGTFPAFDARGDEAAGSEPPPSFSAFPGGWSGGGPAVEAGAEPAPPRAEPPPFSAFPRGWSGGGPAATTEAAAEPAPPRAEPPPDPALRRRALLRQFPWVAQFWSELARPQQQRVARRLTAGGTPAEGHAAAWDRMGLAERVDMLFGSRPSAAAQPGSGAG